MPKTAMQDEFLSVPELAELLHVSPWTIYKWQHKRTGPVAHRIGKYLRFRRSDVNAWLAERAAA